MRSLGALIRARPEVIHRVDLIRWNETSVSVDDVLDLFAMQPPNMREVSFEGFLIFSLLLFFAIVSDYAKPRFSQQDWNAIVELFSRFEEPPKLNTMNGQFLLFEFHFQTFFASS